MPEPTQKLMQPCNGLKIKEKKFNENDMYEARLITCKNAKKNFVFNEKFKEKKMLNKLLLQ